MSTGLQQHDRQPSNGCLHFLCSPLVFQDYVTRCGFWIVALQDRFDILEVRSRNTVRYGRFPHEHWWTLASMVNGKVAGPFTSKRSARKALEANAEVSDAKRSLD